MKICVLGPLELRPDTGAPIVPTGTRQRLLLAALVLHAPRVVSADRLIDILWHDNLPADPAAALRTQISRLRTLLGKAGADKRVASRRSTRLQASTSHPVSSTLTSSRTCIAAPWKPSRDRR